MKYTVNSNHAVGVATPNQNQRIAEVGKKFGLNTKELMALTMLVVGMSSIPAHAADAGANFSLDISSIVSGIATLVTLVTSVGLAFLSVMLVIKAFGYIKKTM